MAEVRVDASEFAALSKAIARLPAEIRAKAAARAMRRVAEMTRSRIVKRSAERVDLKEGLVRSRTKSRQADGGSAAEIVMRSKWIPLIELGARQTAAGVSVRGRTRKLRGSHASAFIAGLKAGKGVAIREGRSRLPITELFGPNPAHDVVNNADVFLKVLVEVAESHLLPRYLHEVERLLPR